MQTLSLALCKHRAGLFLRRCLLEYKRMSFSQVVRFHERWQLLVRKDGGLVDGHRLPLVVERKVGEV